MFSVAKRVGKLVFKLIGILFIFSCIYFFYTNYQNLKQVHKYDEKISLEAKKQGIEEYADVLSSIMLTESKGYGEDPMQSSESVSSPKDKIKNPDQSIEQGVSFFAQALAKSKEEQTDLWTAVQAYNFGLNYIDFVAQNGRVNSKQLAENYSRDILSPQLGNQTKKQYRYFAVHSFIYNGGYLYHNGGNMFYADIVKINQTKWRLTKTIFK